MSVDLDRSVNAGIDNHDTTPEGQGLFTNPSRRTPGGAFNKVTPDHSKDKAKGIDVGEDLLSHANQASNRNDYSDRKMLNKTSSKKAQEEKQISFLPDLGG